MPKLRSNGRGIRRPLEKPRSKGSLLPVPTRRERETGRRENLGTRLWRRGLKKRVAIIFNSAYLQVPPLV